MFKKVNNTFTSISNFLWTVLRSEYSWTKRAKPLKGTNTPHATILLFNRFSLNRGTLQKTQKMVSSIFAHKFFGTKEKIYGLNKFLEHSKQILIAENWHPPTPYPFFYFIYSLLSFISFSLYLMRSFDYFQ